MSPIKMEEALCFWQDDFPPNSAFSWHETPTEHLRNAATKVFLRWEQIRVKIAAKIQEIFYKFQDKDPFNITLCPAQINHIENVQMNQNLATNLHD